MIFWNENIKRKNNIIVPKVGDQITNFNYKIRLLSKDLYDAGIQILSSSSN